LREALGEILDLQTMDSVLDVVLVPFESVVSRFASTEKEILITEAGRLEDKMTVVEIEEALGSVFSAIRDAIEDCILLTDGSEICLLSSEIDSCLLTTTSFLTSSIKPIREAAFASDIFMDPVTSITNVLQLLKIGLSLETFLLNHKKDLQAAFRKTESMLDAPDFDTIARR